MEWTNDEVLQLIDEYENFPILWNPKHPSHYSRNKKIAAWEIIATNLKTDLYEVKRKMNSLQGSFRREKARGRKRIGSGNDRKYVSKWFAFKRLQFLLDRNKPSQTKIDTDKTTSDDEEEENNFDSEYNSQNEEGDQTLNPVETVEVKNEHFPVPRQMKQQRSHKYEEPRIEEAYHSLKQSVASKEQPLDDCAIYSLHIANKLRNYDNMTRAQVEHAINNILFDADMGKYDNPFCNPFQKENI